MVANWAQRVAGHKLSAQQLLLPAGGRLAGSRWRLELLRAHCHCHAQEPGLLLLHVVAALPAASLAHIELGHVALLRAARKK